jgi:hypothetical protein
MFIFTHITLGSLSLNGAFQNIPWEIYIIPFVVQYSAVLCFCFPSLYLYPLSQPYIFAWNGLSIYIMQTGLCMGSDLIPQVCNGFRYCSDFCHVTETFLCNLLIELEARLFCHSLCHVRSKPWNIKRIKEKFLQSEFSLKRKLWHELVRFDNPSFVFVVVHHCSRLIFLVVLLEWLSHRSFDNLIIVINMWNVHLLHISPFCGCEMISLLICSLKVCWRSFSKSFPYGIMVPTVLYCVSRGDKKLWKQHWKSCNIQCCACIFL